MESQLIDTEQGWETLTKCSIRKIEDWIRDNPTATEECHAEMRQRLRELKDDLNSKTKNNDNESTN